MIEVIQLGASDGVGVGKVLEVKQKPCALLVGEWRAHLATHD